MMRIRRNSMRLFSFAAVFALVFNPVKPALSGWLDGVTEMKIGKETHPVCPEDYLIQRGLPIRQVADDENAAIEYVKAINLYVKEPEGLHKIKAYLMSNGWIEEADKLLPWLRKNAEAIEALREGARKKDCKFPFFGTRGMPVYAMLLPHLSLMRNLARLLIVQGRYLEHQKKYREALDMYVVIIKMGYHVSKEPILISGLVGVACHSMAVEGIESFILRNRLDVATLTGLLTRLQGAPSAAENYRMAMSGEKAFGLSGADDLFDHPEGFYSLFGNSGGKLTKLKHLIPIVPGKSLGLRAMMKSDMRRYWNRMDEWNELPDHLAFRPEYKLDEGKILTELPSWSLAQMLVPALSRARISFVRSKARTVIFIVQVALEIYRSQHGDYPTNLDSLAGILDGIPVDPFTNEPLKYRRTEDGYVLYSVGDDLVDNGAKESRSKYEPDIVARSPLPEPKPFEPAGEE